MAKELFTVDYAVDSTKQMDSEVMQSSRGLTMTFRGDGLSTADSTLSLFWSIDGEQYFPLFDDNGDDVVVILTPLVPLVEGPILGYVTHYKFPGQWVRVVANNGTETTGVVTVNFGGRESINR